MRLLFSTVELNLFYVCVEKEIIENVQIMDFQHYSINGKVLYIHYTLKKHYSLCHKNWGFLG